MRQSAPEPPGRLLLAVELGPRRREYLGNRLQADCLSPEARGYLWVFDLGTCTGSEGLDGFLGGRG